MEDLIDFAKSNFQYEHKWLEYQWAEASEVSGLRYKCILPHLTTPPSTRPQSILVFVYIRILLLNNATYFLTPLSTNSPTCP